MGTARSRFAVSVGAALALGLLLRMWFVLHPPVFAGDAVLYTSIARNLLRHGVYGFNQDRSALGVRIEPTLIRLPGYPLFLAACFRLFGIANDRIVAWVQVVADLTTCGVCAALAGRLFGRRAVVPVLWLAVLCPFTANYVSAELTETLVLLTSGLAFYALLRWQQGKGGWNSWLWAIAGSLAYSALLRPEQGLLAAAVLPAMTWVQLKTRGRDRLRRLLPVCAAALCVVVPLVPWTIRNWRTFHVLEPLAPRLAVDPGELASVGFDDWFRTWGIEFASSDEVYWNMDGARIDPRDLPPRAYSFGCVAPRGTPTDALPLYGPTVTLLSEYNSTLRDSPSLEARFAALAREKARAAPLCTGLMLPVARLADMLLRPRLELLPFPDRWWTAAATPAQTAFAIFYAAVNLAYLGAGVAGFILWRRRRGTAAPDAVVVWSMVLMVLLRLFLLLTLDNAEPRYTLEFFPVLFALSGALFAESGRPSCDILSAGHGRNIL